MTQESQARHRSFDFAGRLRGKDVGSSGSSFTQGLGYDAFNNLIGRITQSYGLGQVSFTASYTNNRNSSDRYDSAGNFVCRATSGQSLTGGGGSSGGGWFTDNKAWYFDASGRTARWEEDGPWGANEKRGGEVIYDGDGRAAKRSDMKRIRIQGVWYDWGSFNWYHIYSSVTGQNSSRGQACKIAVAARPENSSRGQACHTDYCYQEQLVY
ncbi:hypothetical protein BH10ACI3_BH10ACI3_00360 [soil metagenome]